MYVKYKTLHDIFDTTCDPVDLDGVNLNSLSWADDLMLISKSPEGLQNCLDKLDKYCYKWALSVNSKKTNCMVMSKGIVKRKPEFYYRNSLLDVKDKVVYLGFCITPTLSHNAMIKDRILKANRAFHVLRQALVTSGNVCVSLSLSLFDNIISPILLYGCCIWAIPKNHSYLYVDSVPGCHPTKQCMEQFLRNICKKDVPMSAKRIGKKGSKPRTILVNLKHFEDKLLVLENSNTVNNGFVVRQSDSIYKDYTYEAIHNSYLKFTLNLGKYASNVAARGELGRYPISIKAIGLTIKYWHFIAKGQNPNYLLNKAYNVGVYEKHSWLESVYSTLKTNGLGHLVVNPMALKTKAVYNLVKRRLEAQYIQFWSDKMSHSQQFEHIHKMMDTYKCRDYLNTIKSIETRKIFTNIRTDNSILSISKGLRKGVALENRICICCNATSVEDVEHFLFRCSAFHTIRSRFYHNIDMVVANFNNIPVNEKLKLILDLNTDLLIFKDDMEPEMARKIIISFVYQMYKLRQTM